MFIVPSGLVSYDKDFGLFLQCKKNPLKGFMQQKDTKWFQFQKITYTANKEQIGREGK